MGLMDFERARELVKFGKFLITHLDIPTNSEDLDWFFLLDHYERSNTPTTPGLTYLNWVVSRYFDQDPQEVRYSKSQKDELAKPRRIVQFLALKKFNYKANEIKRFYEKKSHGTISHNANSVEGEMETNKVFASEVNKLLYKVTSYEETRQVTRDDSTGVFKSVQDSK